MASNPELPFLGGNGCVRAGCCQGQSVRQHSTSSPHACIGVWGGAVLTGCVGVRKDFVSPFRTEDWEAERHLVIKLSLGDINYWLSLPEKWSRKGIETR